MLFPTKLVGTIIPSGFYTASQRNAKPLGRAYLPIGYGVGNYLRLKPDL